MNRVLKEGVLPFRTGTSYHPLKVFVCKRCGTTLLSDEYNNKREERCPLCRQFVKPSFFKTLKFHRLEKRNKKEKEELLWTID